MKIIGGSFGTRLRQARRERDLTQKELADMLGQTSQKTISVWEHDRFYPEITTLVRLCRTLNVSADYLLGITDYSYDPEKYTEKEAGIIKDYRRLDEIGQEVIDGNLRMQAERCQKQNR